MNIKQSLVLALKSIMASKLRSALTMLGIIIGVAAVIILVSIMGGFSNLMQQNFASLGSNIITIIVSNPSPQRSVDEADVEEIVLSDQTLFADYSPLVSMGSATIKYGSTNFSATGYGVSQTYVGIKGLELAAGSFINYLDSENRLKVCVIGSYVNETLFDGADPIGRLIKINGEQFKIVGVLGESNGGSRGSDDNSVYIPYTTAARMVGLNEITTFTVSGASTEVMNDASAKLEQELYDRLGSEDYYSVMSYSIIIDRINEIMSTFTLMLIGIAGISLLVGGIGIMNIMIVSVTERTREIGIRMSVGARSRDILGQFLIEAATTSAAGGILGIILGILASFPLGNVFGVTAAISVKSISIAFLVSAGIGIIFGFFPARKASRMNPIDALRYE